MFRLRSTCEEDLCTIEKRYFKTTACGRLRNCAIVHLLS